jgi:hypothetical protein
MTNEELEIWQQAAPGRSTVMQALIKERDKDIVAGVERPAQTIVGQVSGAGNRHVSLPKAQVTGEFRVPNAVFKKGGTGTITVTTEDVSGYTPGTGVSEVDDVDTLTFDQDVFEIFDGGGGQCVVRLKTCDATCP